MTLTTQAPAGPGLLPDSDGAVRLWIGSGERLGPDLTARVNQACAQAEDHDAGILLLSLGEPMTEPGGVSQGPYAAGVQDVSRWEGALRRLERLAAVTVAVADGWCGGPAIEALLAADYRIAWPEAAFVLPGGSEGIWPGLAAHRLADQIGKTRARRLALLNPVISAAEALDLDLIDEVCDAPEARLREIERTVCSVQGTEWAIRRRLVLDASNDIDEALGSHLAACDRVLRHAQGEPGEGR